MNKEIYQQGYLTKSPPIKFWRAKWRRRWFTLKQGEIPGQFCLEYYTDPTCRKLKGSIDLDQCEQVDSGLRLEHRKQKFQFMFDIKTPNRTYYLAAETENDMKDWVNCICQVCNLHDLSKPEKQQQQDNFSSSPSVQQELSATETSNNTRISESVESDEVIHRTEQLTIQSTNIYQNNDFPLHSNLDYSNRDTIICENSLLNPKQESYDNIRMVSTITIPPLIQSPKVPPPPKGIKPVKKIPENLVLTNNTSFDSDSNSINYNNIEPSPALSTSSSSGPYIPISECFSGSKIHRKKSSDPMTPLNNLDPKYETAAKTHHTNLSALNLSNDQSYSPKITNISQLLEVSGVSGGGGSGSATDSDEDDSRSSCSLMTSKENIDVSTENEPLRITYSYTHRFSKMPEQQKKVKRHDEQDKFNCQLSDTENNSPRSRATEKHWLKEQPQLESNFQHYRQHVNNAGQLKEQFSPSPKNPIAASTPNLLYENSSTGYAKNQITTPQRSSLYDGSLPTSTTKLEGDVFRFDFPDQNKLPPVNRYLKPKVKSVSSPIYEDKQSTEPPKPPNIDRKLKPQKSIPSPSNRRQHSMCDVYMNHDDINGVRTLPRNQFSSQFVRSQSVCNPKPLEKHQSNPKLQYVELDGSGQQAIPVKQRSETYHGAMSSTNGPIKLAIPSPSNTVHVVYNQIDFLKTDAINKTRRSADRQE